MVHLMQLYWTHNTNVSYHTKTTHPVSCTGTVTTASSHAKLLEIAQCVSSFSHLSLPDSSALLLVVLAQPLLRIFVVLGGGVSN